MKRCLGWLALILLMASSVQAGSKDRRIGGGVNYWVALEDLDEGFDDNGLSYLVS